jgi:type II secretory pathway component PulF
MNVDSSPTTTGSESREIIRVLGKAHHALSVTYGIALVVCWVGLQAILFVLLIPHLSEMYADFGGELPQVTVWLVNLSGWLHGSATPTQAPGWYVALPVAAAACLAMIYFMYRVPFGFYLIVPILIGSVFVEIAYLLGPLYQLAGNIANF